MYKIKEVERLTGIKAHTIRMWEKRYGFLSPKRTETKIRNYSNEDLLYILNISLLYQNGWKIATLATLSEAQIRQEVATMFSASIRMDSTQNLLVKALLELNEYLFTSTIHNATHDDGFENVYMKHILPFLDRIGIMWQVGTINPAQEHFISNLIRQVIIVEIDKLPSTSSDRIDFVLACPPDEWHEIGLLYYHYILKKNNQTVLYLGQNVPVEGLINTINVLQPARGIVLSFVKRIDEEEIVSLLTQLREKTHIPIYLGGAQSEKEIETNLPRIYKINNLIGSFV